MVDSRVAEVSGFGDEPLLPSALDVRAQLARILASTCFDVPDRIRRFLTYVVEETMAGRADRLKAFSIAIGVFGRDASFDARTDPLMRIEASRIRRALERYYLTAGKDDPIVITIPKGAYVPAFAAPAGEPAAAEPSEAVAPVVVPARRTMPRSFRLPSPAARSAKRCVGYSKLRSVAEQAMLQRQASERALRIEVVVPTSRGFVRGRLQAASPDIAPTLASYGGPA